MNLKVKRKKTIRRHKQGYVRRGVGVMMQAPEGDIFDNLPPELMQRLGNMTQAVTFLPGEYIIRKGDVGEEMYFIKKGVVEVVNEDGTQVYDTMSDGSM